MLVTGNRLLALGARHQGNGPAVGAPLLHAVRLRNGELCNHVAVLADLHRVGPVPRLLTDIPTIPMRGHSTSVPVSGCLVRTPAPLFAGFDDTTRPAVSRTPRVSAGTMKPGKMCLYA